MGCWISRRAACSMLGTLFVAALWLLIAQPAHAASARAATVPVTNTLDAGPGSLRQAVLDAANGDTVVFNPAVFNKPLTITLTGGQIEITKSLTIDGAHGGMAMPTISGENASRVFSVTTGVTVTLSGLRIANGYCENCYGAGVYNSGTLNVISSTFAGNAANYSVGSGLYNSGTAEVAGSTFVGNGSPCNGGGGGIANSGLLTLTGSLFSNNCAASGGGAVNVGVMSVQSTLLSGNTAGIGGGLYTAGGLNSGGVLTVTGSTFVSNTASGQGGAIIVMPGGALWVANDTFAGNSARYSGGGLLVFDTSHADILNSTFAENSAPEGGGILNAGVITLTNTLVADSPSGGNCVVRTGRPITDGGHNLDSGNTCGFSAPGSLSDTNPLLGALGSYGGSVMTVPLLPGSPAIDAGDDAACPATDARGIKRPVGSHCDIGAYEAFNRYWWMPVVRR